LTQQASNARQVEVLGLAPFDGARVHHDDIGDKRLNDD
jgi:hypothetical protein